MSESRRRNLPVVDGVVSVVKPLAHTLSQRESTKRTDRKRETEASLSFFFFFLQ